jgi:uncharacterized repeat protein (TIGR01451 family)
LEAKRGDTVSWLINYDVVDATANDVTIRDTLPNGVTLVPGSITWFDPNHPSGEVLPDTALGAGGVDVGNYQAGSGGAIRFRTTVDEDIPTCEALNTAFGRATNISEQSDTAKVTVQNCKPTVPTYSCDLLKAELVGDKTYKFTVNASAAGGATIKSYTYNFGDNSTPLTTDQTSVQHTYQPGSYLAKVTVNVRVDGQDKTADSATCKVPIKVTVTPPVVTPPPSAKQLPNAGPGDVLSIFGATSAGSAVAYQVVARRKLRK